MELLLHKLGAPLKGVQAVLGRLQNCHFLGPQEQKAEDGEGAGQMICCRVLRRWTPLLLTRREMR